jgi:hypothetical protein
LRRYESSEMQDGSPSSAFAASPVHLVAAGVIALAIFIVDTATPLDIAIAVLYVVVVLMAATLFSGVAFCSWRRSAWP